VSVAPCETEGGTADALCVETWVRVRVHNRGFLFYHGDGYNYIRSRLWALLLRVCRSFCLLLFV
jgi:hypothetical protein